MQLSQKSQSRDRFALEIKMHSYVSMYYIMPLKITIFYNEILMKKILGSFFNSETSEKICQSTF